MEPNLFKYIWRYSRREQIGILLLVAISLPFYFISLSVPKDIVNTGIIGQGYAGPGDTQSFLAFDLPLSETLFGAPITLFEGFQLEQESMLLGLSFTFLALVIVNGLFKFQINTAKGRLGERMLRRLRFELADRLLRFRILSLRKMKGAEVATMVKDEVEPLGGFIGDAFVTPAFLGGQALTAMAFIMVQSLWLGLIAGAIVLVQALLIPKLRKRILVLGRQRQLTARALAGRISELLDGATEVHANDATHWERAEISNRLGLIFGIRFEIFQRKFFVKFLNNFLSQLTPFIFYALGGILALRGSLDIGALVAVIAAYKDLPGPVRDLINWEQQRNDVQIKYEQVIEQFQPGEIIEPEMQDPEADDGQPLSGAIVFSSVSLADDSDNNLIEGVTLNLPLDSATAVVGDSGSGKEYLPQLIVGLLPAGGGTLTLGGRDVGKLPEAVIGRRLGYADNDSYLFPSSVRENLLYGVKHRPLREADYDEEAKKEWDAARAEAGRSANSLYDINADWIDYEALGVTNEEELRAHLLRAVALVGFEDDVYRYGLYGAIDPEERPQVAEGVLQARAALAKRLEAEGFTDLVARFDRDSYNMNATLAENLLFGTPTKPDYAPDALGGNRLVIGILDDMGLTGKLQEMGLKIAEFTVEIFADLPPGHPFFDQFSFITADDLPDYEAIVGRAEKDDVSSLNEADRTLLLGLPFRYVEARHRLDLVDAAFAAKVVEARQTLAKTIEDKDPGAVAFYDLESYNGVASLLDNVLFGRLVYGRAEAQETLERIIGEVLSELDLREAVLAAGLDYQVGIGGNRLSATQRQKTALARALVKRPDLLVINEATAVMDGATRSRIVERVLEARRQEEEGRRGIFWTLERATLAQHFDQVVVMKNGRVAEVGGFEELNKDGTALAGLLSSD
ncbi:MAG: ATP-binding cassette domain-containing protein [Rhodovibrionaceae bacterium]